MLAFDRARIGGGSISSGSPLRASVLIRTPARLMARKHRRDLIDLAGELTFRLRLEAGGIDQRESAFRGTLPSRSMSVATQFDRAFVDLLAAFEHRSELRRLADHHGEHAGSERIESAEMSDARRFTLALIRRTTSAEVIPVGLSTSDDSVLRVGETTERHAAISPSERLSRSSARYGRVLDARIEFEIQFRRSTKIQGVTNFAVDKSAGTFESRQCGRRTLLALQMREIHAPMTQIIIHMNASERDAAQARGP